MILEIDAGNTAIKWRIVDSSGAVVSPVQRLFLHQIDEFKRQVGGLKIERARVSSVAGRKLIGEVNSWIEQYCGVTPEVARTQKSFAGLRVSYPEPQRLGVDRWLAMLAAMKDRESDFCVIDCGSAITVDLVGERGQHQGGYIVPGVGLMRKSVLGDTQQIKMTGVALENQIHWGKNTDEAVNFGILRMAANFIDSIFAELKRSGLGCRVYMTGGDAGSFRGLLNGVADLDIVWNDALVLDGLAIALP